MLASASQGVCLVRGGCLVPGGSAPRGVVCLVRWGVPGPRGVCSQGGGVSGPRGCFILGPGGAWSQGGSIPACTEADTPTPVDRHTLVKTLPWPNFVAAGNKLKDNRQGGILLPLNYNTMGKQKKCRACDFFLDVTQL